MSESLLAEKVRVLENGTRQLVRFHCGSGRVVKILATIPDEVENVDAYLEGRRMELEYWAVRS